MSYYIGRKNSKSNQDIEQIKSIMNLIGSIFQEVESFVHQIVLDNFSEDITMALSSKLGMQHRGTIASIQIHNSSTDIRVIYDMTVMDLLKFCASNTLEALLNEKVPQMVEKTLQKNKDKGTKIVYLDHSFS